MYTVLRKGAAETTPMVLVRRQLLIADRCPKYVPTLCPAFVLSSTVTATRTEVHSKSLKQYTAGTSSENMACRPLSSTLFPGIELRVSAAALKTGTRGRAPVLWTAAASIER